MLALLSQRRSAAVVLLLASGCAVGVDPVGPPHGRDSGSEAAHGTGGSAGTASGASGASGAAAGSDNMGGSGGDAGDVTPPDASSVDDATAAMDAADASIDAGIDAPVDTGGCPGGGMALQFSGTASVTANLGASLPIGNTARTVEMWTSVTAYTKDAAFFEYGTNTTDQGFALDVDVNNRLEFYAWNDDFQFDTGLATPADWFHLAVVCDGAGKVTAYVNGVEKGTKQYPGLATVVTTLSIGHSALVNQTLNGAIDEVRVWNVVRSHTQLIANMKKRLVGNETGLVGYWRFDDGTGAKAVDSSSKKNDATLVNGPTWVPSGAPLTCQ